MLEALKPYIPYGLVKRYRRWLQNQQLRLYRGDKVECPLCRAIYKEFAPKGLSGGKHNRCINCQSLPGHRLQYLFLKNKTPLFRSSATIRLLHIAPEKPLFDQLVKRSNLKYTRCDKSPDAYHLRDVTEVEEVDVSKMPYGDGSFDVILCNHVLEYVDDDQQALRELYRVMTPGGWGIFQVPMAIGRDRTYEAAFITDAKERKEVLRGHSGVRLYGRDYLERLKKAGFTVAVDLYGKQMNPEDARKYGINPNEMIFLCKK
ncbi:methyltransferase domain-containing protein [Mucilaginibacter sp. RS28]|uniref:Methyltransferase domain-containing protein n=1 Tax=Mucilaginibacter straminoryzae TaxID=2932774 RepID=A0A9X1X5A3_9SPHI|nr:class I SAM-dependent methyltransferase [Mucilaginibacter straminoryzae]MCJ8209848.1 methyltransferase domain-containing protein [Mucilaginibacter straminoryzae]